MRFLSIASWRLIEPLALAALFFLPYSKSAAEICIWSALVLWFVRKFPGGEKFPSFGIANAAYAAFLAFTVFSCFRAQPGEWIDTARGVLKWLRFIGIFFMVGEMCSDPGRRTRLVRVFLASLFLLCLDGFWQIVTGKDPINGYSTDVPSRIPRMTACLQSPNMLAAFLSMGLPLIFYVWLKESPKKLQRILFAAFLILAGAAFMLTYSRAAFYALLLSAFLYVLLRKPLLAVPVALAPIAALFLSPALRQNFITSLRWDDITIGERWRYWQTAWRMIEAHPFVGNGVNLFYAKFGAFAPADEAYRGYAHNCYLQMWAEIGLFGLIAFLIPFAAWLPRAFAQEDRNGFPLRGAICVAVAAFLLHSFVDTHFYSLKTGILFWTFWGLFASARPKVIPA